MRFEMPARPGDLDSLHLATTDRDRVLAALTDECGQEDLLPVEPRSLLPHGRWFLGDEEPTVRRFLVAVPAGRWTSVLQSATDWHQDFAMRMSRALAVDAVQLMLHDGDVLGLHLFQAGELVVEHVTSTDYFDLPPRAEGDLGFDPAKLLPACRPGTTAEAIRDAVTPPGRFDVDGAKAFRRMARLLELPPRSLASYRSALLPDGRTVRHPFRRYLHLAFREGGDLDEDLLAPDEEGANDAVPERPEAPPAASDNVLPFRGRPRRC